MPSFLMIQWGIVGFFVVIHFLLGFLRGSSKSTYFTIVSIIMTVITLWIVSRISFNWLFSMISIDSLVALVQSYVSLPDITQYLQYLEDPSITGFVIAILDFVLRIIAFILFYPLIKFSLTISIFKPIWKHGVRKALLKKQNESAQIKFEENNTANKKFVPSKKLNKGVLGRFFGGAMGAVRGFIVAFIFLIPILVIASFASGVTDALPVSDDSIQQLNSSDQELITIPSEVQSILDNISDMNQNGLGAFARAINIGGKSIDRYIFDTVFTTQVKDATEEVAQLNFGEELEGIFGIASILIEGGYLEDDFDINSISSDNLDDIETIFTYISQSDLLNYLIPFAIETGLPLALDQMSDETTDYVNPYDRPETAAALEVFTQIDWSVEFMNVYGIVEAVLQFGSVAELQAYAANPNLILEMTPEEATAFTDIIRAFGNMQSLVLINAGLDYAVTLPQVTSQITWVAPEDVDQYITDRLGFIIDNPDFFIGEDGEISKLADLIEVFFNGDVDLVALMDAASTNDMGALIELQDPEWVGAIFDQFVQMDLIIQSIPIGIDVAMPNVVGEDISQEMADDIMATMDQIEWDAEIINIGNIYSEVLQLGLGAFLGTEVDTFGLIDEVVVNHMDSVRAIVTSIFEGSELVNVAIEIASPAIVDNFVTDPELRDLVNDALMSDPSSGVVDFSFGQEVSSLLTIFESLYGFTTASELGGFSTMEQDAKVELFSKFGSLTEVEYTAFEDAFAGLQLLERMGTGALDYIKTSQNLEELYVPTEVDLGHDVTAILGLAYYAAKYTYDNRLDYDSYEEIDFAPLLADETFRSYLLSTDDENHSNLIFTNIAYNIKRFSEDEALSAYVAIPTTLADVGPEDTLWETEVNAFLGAILDLGASFEDSTVLTLSVRDVLAITGDTATANLEIFTQFADEAKATLAFGSLDSSQILRTSLVNIINTLGESTVASIGYALHTPDIALDGEMLAQGMIVELINGLAIVAADAFETMSVSTLGDYQALGDTVDFLNVFTQLEDESLDALGDITIIRGMISDALLSPDLQAYLVDTMNTSQELLVLDDDFFAVDPILLDTEGAVKAEEISGLLIAVRSLGLADSEALASIGLDTFTGLIDKNVDIDTGEDDFDRVLGSGYLYITLDKIFQLDAIGTFVGDTLSTSLGTDMSSLDLSLPDAALGNAIDDEEIEVNRIPKDEFRRMMGSIAVLGDLTTIGLDTFSSLVDPTLPEDDFTTFIASDFIYIVLGRLFENEGFGSYVSGMLGGAFGNDPITLTMGAPEDAKGTTGVEDGLMTRYELRRLMISFDMLGLSDGTDISVTTIMGMIGANEDLAGEDDFDRFLLSKYLDDKISQLLLSQQVVELIAAGQFEYADFVIPTVAIENGRLSNQEIYDLFSGLNLLGLSDFENVDLGLDTVTSLSSGEIDQLLSSTYLYLVVDLMIKSQDTLAVPDSAFETSGDFNGMIQKTEVQDVFSALNILGITDLTTVDPATITIGDISEVLAQTDSAIVQSLLSQAIIDALDPNDEGIVPDDAYEGDPADGLLSSAEIDSLIEALDILGGGDPDVLITDIDVANITVGDVDALSDTESNIIKQMISDAIVDAIGAGSIPDEAYGLSSPSSGIILLGTGVVQLAGNAAPRLTDTELQAMIDALVILANNDMNVLITDISTAVTVGQAVQLKGTPSFVIKQLVSDSLVDVLGVDAMPADAFIGGDVNTRLIDAEIDLMIDALEILSNGNNTMLVTDISTDINVGQVKDLSLLPSLVTKQLISDAVTDQIDPLDEGKIPDEAREGGISTNRLTDAEITAMILALEVLSNHDDNVLVTAISTDVTVGQVKELKGTASYIIKQLVSDSVIDVIGVVNVPLESYIDGDANNRLTDTEIDAMIDALDVLGEDSVLVTAISTDVTVGQAKELKGTPSYIIKQMVSDAVVDVIGVPNIPLESYISSDPLNRLTDSEIDAMIDALDILGEDTVLVTAISTDVNVGQALQFKGTPSYIIKQLLSDAIIDAIDPLDEGKIPDVAHISSDPLNRLTDSEIDSMIDAIDILANGDQNLPVASISTDINIGQVKDLNALTSSITTQLISDSIIDAVGIANVPDDAYIADTPGNNLKSTEVDAMILALEILAGSVVPGDVDTVLVSSVSTNVTIGQAQDLDTSGTGSSIIKFIISDSIITMITAPKIPATAYNTTYTDRLSDQEITDMLAVLSILGAPTDPVSTISTDINIGQLKSLNASPSLIMEKLISDSIIDAVGVANVPLDAYVDEDANNYITEDEISAMILAIEILSGSTTPGDVDHVLVSSVSTNVTIGQAQDLDTSGTGSSIIKFIVSDSIITMITEPKIPASAYNTTYTDRLSDQEITDMLGILGYLGAPTDPVSTIDVDITIGQLKDIKASPSLIMTKLISDSIIDAVGLANVPDDAYIADTPGNNLKSTEVDNMILALEVFAGSTVPGDQDATKISAISTANVTVGQTQDLSSNGSAIIKFIISDSVITMFGVGNIPAEAYHLIYTDRLSDEEIVAIADALAVLGAPGDSVTTLSTDVTVGQTQALDTTATGSVIIKQMISDSVVDMLGAGRIPDTAYIASNPANRLTDSEIGYMQESLLPLAGGNPNTLVSAITVTESTLSVTTLKAFPDQSIIMNRMISTAIITNMSNIPSESYVPLSTEDILRSEIDYLLDALDILGIGTDGAGSISAAAITFEDLYTISAYGESDPLGYSPIIDHILSTPMISAVTNVRGGYDYGVPSTAYRNTYDLLHAEIVSLIDALAVIGDVAPANYGTTTIADVTVAPSGFNSTKLAALIALDALIVYRLISIGINDATLANDDAYAEIGDVNYDPDLNNPLIVPVPALNDIKIAEMNHIVASMNIIDPTETTSLLNLVGLITVAKLKALTPTEIETLVEAGTNGPNTIIYYIISETVDPTNTLYPDDNPATFNPTFDSGYVMDSGVRIRLQRSSISAALLLI